MSEDFTQEITDMILRKTEKFALVDKLPAVQILQQMVKGLDAATVGYQFKTGCKYDNEEAVINYSLYVIGETLCGYKTRHGICQLCIPIVLLLEKWPVFVKTFSGDNIKCFNENDVMKQLKVIVQDSDIINDMLPAA